MDWIIFLWTGVNRVAWYHCSSSVLVIAQRALSAAGCFWLGRWSVFLVSLTCHILYMFYQVPFNTVKSSFTTLMWVMVKVAVHPTSQSFPFDIRSPDCWWGKMCGFLAILVRRGLRLSNGLLVACISMTPVSMTWGTFFIGFLFLNRLFTLIQFWVAPVLSML